LGTAAEVEELKRRIETLEQELDAAKRSFNASEHEGAGTR
jgi:hypothetical protein